MVQLAPLWTVGISLGMGVWLVCFVVADSERLLQSLLDSGPDMGSDLRRAIEHSKYLGTEIRVGQGTIEHDVS